MSAEEPEREFPIVGEEDLHCFDQDVQLREATDSLQRLKGDSDEQVDGQIDGIM